jgi:hypothetical protein
MAALLFLCLVVAGRWVWHCLGPADARPASADRPSGGMDILSEDSFCGLLSGVALASAGVFLLAHFGRLTVGALGASGVVGATGCLFVCAGRRGLGAALAGLKQSLAFGVLAAGLVVLLGALLPPIDTTLGASDSSVYLANARQLAGHGTTLHHDGLAAEMTAGERDVLFRNRFVGDHTGPHARFPGGVPLVSPSGDLVSFYFYHLFPAWLGAGLLTVGDQSYLQCLALFGVIGLLSLFFIGRRLGGAALGLALCAVHASFYPQAFYCRFPSSELPAQALFLSGLFAFLRGLGLSDGERRAHVRLAALLWGTSCLCRVDAIPFLWLGLTVVSLLAARLRVRAEDYAVPMLTSILFAVMAAYHQLASGIDYVGAFSPGKLASTVSAFVAGRTWPSAVVVAALAAAGLFVHRAEYARPFARATLFATRAFGLLVSAVIAVRFLWALDWSQVARHARWIGMYTTPLVLVVLGVGAFLSVLEVIRARAAAGVAVVVAFLAGPAACYLIDPMVIPLQPWAMRRFVPVVFPLLLVVALYGLQAGLRRWFRARPALGDLAFATVAVAIAVRFLASSAGLFVPAASPSAAAEVRSLDRAIPPGALVLVPDEIASLHLQLALEYTCGRDVLLLPLDRAPDAAFEEVAAGFIRRRLESGASAFVVQSGAPSRVGFLAHRFQIAPRLESTLSFEEVPFVRDDALPGLPRATTLRVHVLEVRSLQGTPGAAPPRADR